MAAKKKRIANDAYYTDPKLALSIVNRLHPLLVLPDAPAILEPSAGDGAFCWAAREVYGPDAVITAVEPHPTLNLTRKWLTNGVIDFLHRETIEAHIAAKREPLYADLTLGNPPYLHAEEHLALVRPISKYVVFLLRLGFLGSQGRSERIFSKPGLRYLMSVAERPSFVHDATDKYEYAVFVWQHEYQGLAQILPPLWVEQ